jgi:hypothetical protein
MTDNDIPVRDPQYLLERIDNDYQLRHRSRETAIYINDAAALLWELCDGRTSVAGIKQLLREAYPNDARTIDADVDEALGMLAGHAALTSRPAGQGRS